ncbi:hypothetical protein C8F01DRAFT_1243780 [Mycena amicta]|nr:hypothetical protein C8F01DRAFT_1243780 [Mycena amicta]
MREINTAAEWYFRRNRAEAMMLDAAAFGFDDYDGDDDSDSDSDATDSDSEYERRRSRKKKRRGSSGVRKGKEGGRGKTTATAKGKAKFTGNEEEIAGMIKQLNGMKLEDPDYAPTYYKVLALDQTGNAVQCIKSPSQARVPNQQPGFTRRPSYTTNSSTARVPEMSGGAVPRPSVATFPNNIPLGELVCYGCGKPGHRMDKCEGINELVSRGILGHNSDTRRLELRSGAPLRRLAGEWLLDAVERITKGPQKSSVMLTFTGPMTGTARAVQNFYQSHARIQDLSTDESDLGEDSQRGYGSSDSEEEDDHTVYLSVPKTVQFDGQNAQIYEADRTVPSIRQARRMAFDGVEMPPRRHGAGPSTPLASTRRNISRVPSSKAPPSSSATPAPPTQNDPASGKAELDNRTSGVRQPIRPPTPPLPHTKKSADLPVLAPVEARRPRHTPMEGIEREGASPVRAHDQPLARDPVDPPRKREGSKSASGGQAEARPAGARQSAISTTHPSWICASLRRRPPRLLTPAILAPPVYVPPIPPDSINDTTVFNRAEVTAVQVLASMRERSLAHHTGRPTVLRQFSTNQLQPPRESSPSNDPYLPVEMRRMRPLPRRARLLLEPNRPPTPYPHLDGVIVEAVRRLQVAVINGLPASPLGHEMLLLGDELEDSVMHPDDEPVGTTQNAPATFHSLSTLAQASVRSAEETTTYPESIAYQPVPTLGALNLPSTASVSQQAVQGLQQVGLPAFCPPATQSLPLFRPIPEFDPTILAFLGHYLQGAPVLTGLTRAVDEVRRLVPPAQQAETHARVLAGVLPALERRASQAQSQLAPDLVHGWVIFYEAVREAQGVLDERAQEQIEEACRATAEYQAWMTRVNEEIDARGKEEMEAYQLTHVMMDTPSATASVGYTTPLNDFGTHSSWDEMDEEYDALDLELLDATMEAAQLSMAAMRIVDEEDGSGKAQTKNEDGNGLTAERESEVETWEVHVHEASYWGFFPPSASASPPPDTPSVSPQFTMGVHPFSSTYSLLRDEVSSPDRAISVSSSDSSDDELVPQYLQVARDLGHEGRYDEAREYWWAALNGTDSEDDLSPLDFTSAVSSPTYEPIAPLETENWSWTFGSLHSSTTIPEAFSAASDENEEEPLGLESLIHSQFIEEASTISPNDPSSRVEADMERSRVASITPEYRAQIATALIPPMPAAVFEGKQDPRPWYRLEPSYLDNNPMVEPYHNRPVYDDLPKLKLSDYAEAGAFKSAPLHLGLRKSSRSASVPLSTATTPPVSPSPSLEPIPPSGSPTMSPQPFTQHIAELRRHIFPYEGDSVGGRMFDELAGMTRALDVEQALAFSWLHKAAHLAYDPHGLGQLVDYERMREPNGQRVEFDWDIFEKPIVVDAERDELKEHFFYGHHFDLLQAAYELRQMVPTLPTRFTNGFALIATQRVVASSGWSLSFTGMKWGCAKPCIRSLSSMGIRGRPTSCGACYECDMFARIFWDDFSGTVFLTSLGNMETQSTGPATCPASFTTTSLSRPTAGGEHSDSEPAESTPSESSSDISFSYFTGAYYLDAEYQYSSDEGSGIDEVVEAVANFSLALSGPSLPRPGFNLTLPISRRTVPAGLEDSDAHSATVEADDAATHDDRTLETGGNAVVEDDRNTTSKV